MESKYCSTCPNKRLLASFLKDASANPGSKVFATCIPCREKSKKRRALQPLDPNRPSKRPNLARPLFEARTEPSILPVLPQVQRQVQPQPRQPTLPPMPPGQRQPMLPVLPQVQHQPMLPVQRQVEPQPALAVLPQVQRQPIQPVLPQVQHQPRQPILPVQR